MAENCCVGVKQQSITLNLKTLTGNRINLITRKQECKNKIEPKQQKKARSTLISTETKSDQMFRK